ncbi:MAG: SusC/RagA family TonB-linked outer membrane protein [Prevotellaceae bacterium]|jgi:TonB-linked SusC/RagA family outer membrane protein|nr:SusC/RagA family TonB-linked outer membrane protein [Prevotellaceae bacterium]
MYYRNFIKKEISCLSVKRGVIMLLALLTVNLYGLSAYAQQSTVTGKITDDSGEVLSGVAIAIKGTSAGIVSDTDGTYSITVPDREAVLVFSYVGYGRQEIVVGSQTVINVQLKSDTELEELVVTALGIKRDARKLGYAATTISAKELTKVGSPNFATALYGKAPGVRINTNQGGSIAGVSINIRGLNSITGGGQPLIVMNGVPIRNGGTGSGTDAAFAEFGSESRVRSNGLVDINPEDIENLTILRGAAATALYGSEAANGVVIIDSKRAREGTFSVDFSASYTVNEIHGSPTMQAEYGPGYFKGGYNDYMKKNDGFYERTFQGANDSEPKKYKSVYFSQYAWGPKYDGTKVLYWDGKERSYWPISGQDTWKDFFQTGFNQNYSLALNQGGKNVQTRFAYTYNKEIPNTPTSNYQRHSFTLNGTLNISKVVSVEYSANYVLNNIHNRANRTMGLFWSFSHGFGTFMDIPLMKKMYKTSLGYRNNNKGDKSLTPDEQFAFNTTDRNGISNVLWDQYDRNVDEVSNRLIAYVAPKFQITDWLSARVQFQTDITSDRQERRDNTEHAIELGNDPSGYYSIVQRRYDIYYADFMLTASKKLSEKFELSASLGWQGRSEKMLNLQSNTDGGLTTENWFHFNASRYQTRTSESYMESLKTAVLGMVDLSWDDYLYVTITGRQDKTSTLRKGSNTFFYPSVSGAFIFTDAFKDAFPEWFQFGKFRTSFGMNGNYPGIYSANVSYESESHNGFIWNHVRTGMGNDLIKPEITKEIELGLETKMFKNRLGLDFTYYYRNINDQILGLPQPSSSGVGSTLMNVGTLRNTGVELNIYGDPVRTDNFSWKTIFNIARNWNTIVALADGIEYVKNGDYTEGIILRSYEGRPMGDWYAQVPRQDEKGNLLTEDGLYVNNPEHQRIGNAQPLFVGGFINNFHYKNVFFEVTTDFSIGGKAFNYAQHYTTALGMTPATVYMRENGIPYFWANNGNAYLAPGIPYYIDGQVNPAYNDETVYYDGVIQPGVDINTGQPNDVIQAYDYLTYYTYNWNTDSHQMTHMHSIFDKSYWKVRELLIGYNFPKSLANKLQCKHIQVSFFMRNLFYIYKAMPDWDVESSSGTSWVNQAFLGDATSPSRSWGFNLRVGF